MCRSIMRSSPSKSVPHTRSMSRSALPMPRLGAGILALGVGDVVDHDGHRAAVGAALGAGEDVGVVLGHDAEGGSSCSPRAAG